METPSLSDSDDGNVFVNAYDYFKGVFGFQESIASVYELVSAHEDEEGFVKLQTPNGELNAGKFEVVAIEELERRCAELPESKRLGKFHLIEGNGIRTRNFEGIDVGAIQMDANNCGATFQVASNFNCLEFISSSDRASRGITKYVSDHTQGPAASISCAPATLFRNYFVRVSDKNEIIGQLEQQINLLEAHPLIPVVNGYVKFDPESLARVAEEGRGKKKRWGDEAVSKVNVGVQWGAQVTSGLKTNLIELCNRSDQKVTQVFSAAVDLGGWGNPSDNIDVINISNMLLKAAYRAAYLTARLNAAREDGNSKCFLTLIGGGVFHNKTSWIVDAILQTDLIAASGVDFYLVLFNGTQELDSRSYDRLVKLMDKTGGSRTYVD